MAEMKIVVDTKAQQARLYRGDELVRTYRISTAANGLGSEKGSYKTPTGKLRVAKKIGDACPHGTVFKSRVDTGQVWSRDPANPLCSSDEDLVLSRILWLEGCEPHNANTIERYIYIHGTNQEHLLGTPASHGCVRFSNQDVVELYDLVPEGTSVEVI
jgi:L,D-transpeptidase YbiS